MTTTLGKVCSKSRISKGKTLQMKLDLETCGHILLNGRDCSLRSGQSPEQASHLDSLHVAQGTLSNMGLGQEKA